MTAGLLRRLRNIAFGRDLFVRPDVLEQCQFFGSAYGGWFVATHGLGPESVVYSFGIGEDASFDVAMIEAWGVSVDAFDPTPRCAAWVDAQRMPGSFVFHPYGLADKDGVLRFYEPTDRRHVSHSCVPHGNVDTQRVHEWQVRRLDSIMAELGHDRIDVLKMDIEGGEYAVLESICAGTVRPGQILVEFHHHFRGISRRRSQDAVKALRAIGYRVFSVSRTALEYGFVYRPQMTCPPPRRTFSRESSG
jgi:FkbM family methyltransferase